MSNYKTTKLMKQFLQFDFLVAHTGLLSGSHCKERRARTVPIGPERLCPPGSQQCANLSVYCKEYRTI